MCYTGFAEEKGRKITFFPLQFRLGNKPEMQQSGNNLLRLRPADCQFFDVYARCSNSSEVSRMTIEGSGMWDAYTQISDAGGFLQAKLNEPLRYFLLMPQPDYDCGQSQAAAPHPAGFPAPILTRPVPIPLPILPVPPASVRSGLPPVRSGF